MMLTRPMFAVTMAFALSACATTRPATQTTSESAMSPPPRVRPEIVEATLDNGLRVYMLEDHGSPLVSFQVWFKVGSVNEHEAKPGQSHGITGLSHFFEHMMFRGTEAHASFFEDVYALGGKLNAFTWLDETVYWENMPSQHLEKVIGMEADRLEHMKIDFLNLEPEREVVKSERLLRTENRPEGLAQELLQSRAFTKFPYHWGTIGWMSDLNAVTVAEAQAYHDVYYAPNNAFILVSGDHDPAQTLEWITKYYGGLQPRPIPPEDFPAEPAQTAERRDRVTKPVDPQVVMWGYRAPAVREPDYAVLEVLDRVLVGGKSSRLQQGLVYSSPPKLGRIYGSLYPIRHPYLYMWGANLEPGMTTYALQAAVDAAVADIVDKGVEKDELARAVAGLRSDIVRQNLSNQSKADMIGWSLRTSDDPLLLLDRLETYGKITVADVQRVAKQVMRADNRTWTTVVDPGRFVALVEQMGAETPAAPAQLTALAKDAAEWVVSGHELDAEDAQLTEEGRAIGLLGERADKHLAEADAAGKKAIREYLDTNEKGTKKRAERLKTGRAALAKSVAAHKKAGAELRKRLTALERAAFSAERGPLRYLHSLVITMLRERKGGAVKLLDLSQDTDPALAGLRLAWGAVMAWLLDESGLGGAGESLRQELLSARLASGGDPLSDGPEALTTRAFALAWDTQVVGREPSPAPVRARAAGSVRGSGR
jgi:zinc protease